MATLDLISKSYASGVCLDKFIVRETTIDFSANAGAASDIVKLFDIPAGTLVLGVYWKVTTAQGATCTVGVGDSASATVYGTAINLNTASEAWSALTEGTPNTIGKLYTAANDIRLTLGHTTDKAVVTVKVFCVNLA